MMKGPEGIIPSGPLNGDGGHPRACLIWDYLKIGFRMVRDGHREILWGDHSQR